MFYSSDRRILCQATCSPQLQITPVNSLRSRVLSTSDHSSPRSKAPLHHKKKKTLHKFMTRARGIPKTFCGNTTFDQDQCEQTRSEQATQALLPSAVSTGYLVNTTTYTLNLIQTTQYNEVNRYGLRSSSLNHRNKESSLLNRFTINRNDENSANDTRTNDTPELEHIQLVMIL